MANWYCTREQVKRAGAIFGTDRDPIVDRLIEASSRSIDLLTRRNFIPQTATKLYRWPNRNGSGSVLWLSHDLISLTTLQTKAQDTSPTTIAATDYFLEPQQWGPPYDRIEIDLSSSAAFEAGDTSQRSISVAGSWGYSSNTRSVGTVSSGLSSSASATSMVCSNAALIDVGDTLLIESEQIFVTERAAAASSAVLNDASVTAAMSDGTITVDDGSLLNAGEIIKVDSEEMLITGISTNDLTVIRAYNGTTLASHADATAVQVFRTLTIERAVNGTTAATHADTTAISKYEPPFDINQLCIAETLASYHQEGAGWGRQVGQGEGSREFTGRDLARLQKTVRDHYQRVREAAI